jgi:hypothetical protein
MNDFKPIDGRLLLQSHGVFKQADLFRYNDRVFAKYGQGFIAINSNHSTSKSKVFWKDLELEADYEIKIGKLVLTQPALSIAGE